VKKVYTTGVKKVLLNSESTNKHTELSTNNFSQCDISIHIFVVLIFFFCGEKS
jgi:hypothetical protein